MNPTAYDICGFTSAQLAAYSTETIRAYRDKLTELKTLGYVMLVDRNVQDAITRLNAESDRRTEAAEKLERSIEAHDGDVLAAIIACI